MTSVNPTDVFKQLVINSLVDSQDLQNEIKSFLFYDKKRAQSIRNKRGINNHFKFGLYYLNDGGLTWSSWSLTYRYETQLHAINCNCCGQFIIANGLDRNDMPFSLTCKCNYEYVDEIMLYVSMRQQQREDVNEFLDIIWYMD